MTDGKHDLATNETAERPRTHSFLDSAVVSSASHQN
jgi:hypothetical protein